MWSAFDFHRVGLSEETQTSWLVIRLLYPKLPWPRAVSPKQLRSSDAQSGCGFSDSRLCGVPHDVSGFFCSQMGLLASPQHEHQPAWPWALFWCPAPLTPDCLLPRAVPHRWRPQPLVACGERGSVTNLSPLSCRCSRFQSEIKRLKISSPVRVCQNCYYSLQHERGAEDGHRNCRDWGSSLGPVSAPSVLKQPPLAQLLTLRISGSRFRGRWLAGTSSEQHKKNARWFQACFRTRVSRSVRPNCLSCISFL